MLNKILIIAVIFSFFSCKKDEIEYYPNGKILKEFTVANGKLEGEYKEYYLNGNIKKIHIYKKGVLIDSSIYYNETKKIIEIQYHLDNKSIFSKIFENNILKSEGKYYSNQKRGKWKYYYQNGKIKQIFEYIDLCGEQYTNQGWDYDKKGELIQKKGNHYSLSIQKKKIKVNETIDFEIKYNPILFLNSNSIICTSQDIDKSFCNLRKIKLDTLYSTNHNFVIRLSYSTKGNKNFRGFIKEFYHKNSDHKDSTIYGERFVYFDIPIKVD